MKTKFMLAFLAFTLLAAFLRIPDLPGVAYPVPTYGPTTTPLPTPTREPTPTYPPNPGPDNPAPEFDIYDCDVPIARAGMFWYDPPVGIGAMSSTSPGLLYVIPNLGSSFTRTLVYDGWYIDVQGKLIHLWHAYYPRPSVEYQLTFFVNSLAGGSYWTDQVLWPSCFPDLWLPLVLK